MKESDLLDRDGECIPQLDAVEDDLIIKAHRLWQFQQ